MKDFNRRPLVAAIAKLALLFGSFGLLSAVAADALAVLGRHTGFSIIGSIEIVQLSALVAISAAIVLATLEQGHAAVHLLTERVSPDTRSWLARLQHLTEAAGFGVLGVGAAWVAIDHWQSQEETDLLRIPLGGFRLFWIACALASCVYSVRLATRHSPQT